MSGLEVRSLWNENATQRSNTAERDCVYFCLCVCPRVFWVIQSKSEFRFCLWLKTKNPPVHRMWATWNSAVISVQYQLLLFSFFSSISIIWILFHLSSSPLVRFRVAQAPNLKSVPCSTTEDTCWASPQRQKLRLWQTPSPSTVAPLRWPTGNELKPHNSFHKTVFTHYGSGPGCTCASD